MMDVDIAAYITSNTIVIIPIADVNMLRVGHVLKILGIDGCANTVAGDGELAHYIVDKGQL